MSIRPWFWALACVWAGAGSAAPMTLPSTASTAQPKSLACSGSRSIARMWHEQLLAARGRYYGLWSQQAAAAASAAKEAGSGMAALEKTTWRSLPSLIEYVAV